MNADDPANPGHLNLQSPEPTLKAMFSNAIEVPQRRVAKLAGFLYLFTILGANLTEFLVRARLSARGDALQAARNIAASGELFRAGIGGDLITLAANVALIAVLFISSSGRSTEQ